MEHSKYHLFLLNLTLGIVLLSFLGCKQKDPSPENKDPVYLELKADLAAAELKLSEKNKDIEALRAEKSNAVPQSGENKAYEKKLNDALGIKIYLDQRVRFYTVRLAERKIKVQRDYLKSYINPSIAWPDPNEVQLELNQLSTIRKKYK